MAFPAVFVDRDGTLMEEVNYCSDPKLVRVFPGTPEALRDLKRAGYRVVIITNQAGIGRGYFTEAQYHAVHAELIHQLGDGVNGVPLIDGTYFCPDAPPTDSPRRKPEPGMVLEAAGELDIDLSRSWFIGDKTADIECGRSAGTRTILVHTGYGAKEIHSKPDFMAKDVVAAAQIILQNSDATTR